ncbi:ABC transporter permease [Brooklawnia sp.]|uniref:ABC transporter permease n=1 Tax=Brooklawnia sp. TaxID=2699740 RepID=UPI003C73450E
MRRLLRVEALLFVRDLPSAVFALIVPALILLGAGLAIPGMRETLTGGQLDGLTMIQVYTPAVLTMALATPALSTLPVMVANYREHGVLRRLSTTPARPGAVLAAQVVINLAAFVVAAALAVLLATVVFAAPLPRQTLTAAIALLAGALAMFGLGMLVAARARTGSAAAAVGMLLYFPLLFLAGMWTPGPLMPDLARQIATYTPLGATSQALAAAWFDTGFPALQVTVLIAWTALLYPLAARTFRWT